MAQKDFSQPKALALISQAQQALAEARTLPELRRVIELTAVAADVARRQVRLSENKDIARVAKSAAIEAESIRLLAEARAGDLLRLMAETGERATQGGDRANSQAASLKDLGVSWSESSRWQQVAAVPEDVREKYVTTVRKTGGDVSRSRLLRLARESKTQQRRDEPVNVTPISNGIVIRHGDFMDVLVDVAPGTVDAIITDPPYARESLPLFSYLGGLAAHILKPSGVLAVLYGQSHLFECMRLLSEALAYRWTGAYIAQGPRTRMHHAHVGTGWKPVLLYQRHDATEVPFLLDDVFSSSRDDKRFHHWGQSESGIASLVERLTVPGALVVDPFLGGGTTAVVCQHLGRQFVGCDNDPAAVSAAIERLSRAAGKGPANAIRRSARGIAMHWAIGPQPLTSTGANTASVVSSRSR